MIINSSLILDYPLVVIVNLVREEDGIPHVIEPEIARRLQLAGKRYYFELLLRGVSETAP